jgi:hypothetical protein
MKYHQLSFKLTPYPEKGYAILSCDPNTQAELMVIRDDVDSEWGSIKSETEILEWFTCNSEWDWIDPSETKDMTDAPIIGIREESISDLGSVIERYAFMSYALRSFLDDLADTGESRWEGGKL